MGQCCLKLLCINTSTHEHNTNLSLLEHRIKVKQATANDEQFTYFKGIGELDRFIDDVLNKENMEDKEKNKKILA